MKNFIATLCVILICISVNAQNVGIGTTTPTDQLHTTGTVRLQNYNGKTTRLLQIDSSGRIVATAAGTVSSNTTVFAIADNGCATANGVSSQINVTSQPNAVLSSKIAVRINITHTFDSDLRIYLYPPVGSSVLVLAAANGGSGDNFSNTIFSDQAATSITTGVAPFTGQFKPKGGAVECFAAGTPASNFADIGGGNIIPNGTWTLRVLDNSGADVGTLNDWAISFTGPESITTSDENNFIPKLVGGNLIASNIYQPAGSNNIGIGTTTPTAKLDVAGTVKITDGTQGVNKVLTSDATGNASWKASSGFTLPFSGSDAGSGTSFLVANSNGAFGANAISGQSFGTANGVQGLASGGKGIFGSANSGTGVDAYSNSGTAGVFTSNSGLAIKTVTGNVEINGKIKIIDGTQGIGKVLTSDGGGLASWALAPGSPSFSASKTTSNQLLANGGVFTKINFNTSSSVGISYSNVNSDYTAPVSGMYHFDVTLNFINQNLTPTTNNSIFISLFKRLNPGDTGGALNNYEFTHTQPLHSESFSATVYLDAGDIIDVRVLNLSGTSITVSANAVTNYTYWGGYRIN